MEMKDHALRYLRKGFSVIPVKQDKKPYFSWVKYQKQLPTEEEITEWWSKYPDANIGIITGQISNLAVVDIDNTEKEPFEANMQEICKYIDGNLDIPKVNTPSGGQHWYFDCQNDTLSNNSRIIQGCDLRANGGYIIAPPSKINGKQYRWVSVKAKKRIALPEAYLKTIYGNNIYNSSSLVQHVNLTSTKLVSTNTNSTSTNNTLYSPRNENADLLQGGYKDVTEAYRLLQVVTDYFKEGRRDNDLFHAANQLIKGKTEISFVEDVLLRLAMSCGFPKQEAMQKVESAMKRTLNKDRHWKQEVEEWLLLQAGYFNVTNCYKELRAVTKENETAIRVALHRLAEEGKLERDKTKAGIYRIKDDTEVAIDFINAPTDEFEIKLPFQIHDLVKIFPRNIIVIAGSSNSGKTALMLNIVEMNQENNKVYYFSSEMGSSEMKQRLQEFDKPLDSWNFFPSERASNFADVIRPDDINIIDYMEIHESHYMIGTWIKDVFDRLNKGIAIIAIQKKPGATSGVGGHVTLEKPRLYLTMEHGLLKIEKAKSFRQRHINPNGAELKYKIVNGCKLIDDSGWTKDGEPLFRDF